MGLTPGQVLATYQILAPLGAGAMGEVYRARDKRLGREVAIKVLPEHFAGDEERLRRFEREARMLASLNHPSVAQIFGFDEVGGIRFLVLELVPGETLEERLERGPLSIGEALEVCRQIAEGVEAAHEVGVIHRDLKPANVRLTPEGKVKVLDFGLAKSVRESGAGYGTKDSAASTEEGRLLGTPTYMAPEQARGRPIDKRVDVWAFGCVLYQCLTGVLAFDGETTSDVLAAVLEREVDWARLPAATPRHVVELLHRCLAKDPRQRLRDIGEARVGLARALAEPDGAGASRVARRSAWAPVVFGAGGALVGAALAYVAARPAPAPAPVVRRFELNGVRSAGNSLFALSPDGRWLAWCNQDTPSRVQLRRLDASETRAVDGSENGRSPFFSPDSRSLAFFAEGRGLCRVGLDPGSVVETITSRAGQGQGAWGPDGTIVFSAGTKDGAEWNGLMRVPASGGAPAVLTTPDGTKGERRHNRPSFLPDGKTVVFTDERDEVFRCESVALETGERRVLVEPGSDARYVASGHLVYGNWDRKELLAVPFDPVALRTTGPAVVAVSGVAGLWRGNVGFDVAEDGTLVYAPGEFDEDETVLVWMDRSGVRTELDPVPSTWSQPKLSPDGKRLLLRKVGSPACTLWMRDLERGVLTRVDVSGDCHDPLWSLDGAWFFYDAAGGSDQGLFRRAAEGGSAAERLAAGREHDLVPASISPDGKTLGLTSFVDAATKPDIDVLELGGERRSFLHTRFAEHSPAFSPDGRYLAYVSDETGTDEVYVRAFPGPGEAIRVSPAGGDHPTWACEGDELFFTWQARMFVVPVSTSPALRLGKPELLFETDAAGTLGDDFDVTPDGQRFVVAISPRKAAPLAFVRVVVNWFEELRRLAPNEELR